jgi:hypothetical protein
MLAPYSPKYDHGKLCDLHVVNFTAPVGQDAVSMQRIKDSQRAFRGCQLGPQSSREHILHAATSLTTVELHSSSTSYCELLDVLRHSNSNIRCLVVPQLAFISLFEGSKFFPERPLALDCLGMLHALNVNITVDPDTRNQMKGFASKLVGCENLWMLKINAWNSVGKEGFVAPPTIPIREHTSDTFRVANENNSTQFARSLKEIEAAYTLIEKSALVPDPRELPDGHFPVHDMIDMCTQKALTPERRDEIADKVDDIDQSMSDFPGIIRKFFRSHWGEYFACTGGIRGMAMFEWKAAIQPLLDVPFPMSLREVHMHTRIPLLASYSFLSLLENLETLVLSYCHITDEILERMAGSFSRFGRLRNLDLMHNNISEFDFRDIRAPESLMLVNLSHNFIVARFATTVLNNFVKGSQKIAVVDLGHNPFTSADEFSFEAALSTWGAPSGARLRLPGTIPDEIKAKI